MDSTVSDSQDYSTVTTRRRPLSDDDVGNRSRRATNHRSLSARLRSLFRKDSSSPNRSTSNSRRQASSSPEAARSSTEASRLRTPIVKWPFGRKKAKLSTTTNTTPIVKTKKKDTRKTAETVGSPPIQVSSSIYDQDNRSSIHGQHFVPRTPEFARGSNERFQPASSFEAVVPDANVFIPPSLRSNHSPSELTDRQRLPNTNIEYHYQNTPSMPSISIPFADVEVIPTPRSKRKVGDSPSMPKTQILTEKPPMFPSTTSRSPLNIGMNSPQLKGASSSGLNKNVSNPILSSSENSNVPKLNAPSIPFDNKSRKKQPKRTKSQSRADAMAASTSTISNLVKANPLQPNQMWTNPYGSLPDAELLYDDGRSSSKPSNRKNDKYPGLSAIVWQHLRRASPYYNERPTTAPTTPHGSHRFETSTATSNEYQQYEPWSRPPLKDSATSTSIQHHDGYIRPMSPHQPSSPPDVSVIRIGIKDLRDPASASPVRRTRYDSPEPSVIYRSTTTIYTRDRNNHLGSGEIRTWSSQERGFNSENYETTYRKPHTFVEVERTNEQYDKYDNQVVPPKKVEIHEEFRYSPRAHEEHYKQRERRTTDDSDESIHEEKYEVSYVYEGSDQKYVYETRPNYDEKQSISQFSTDGMGGTRNMITSNPISAIESSNITEREKVYDNSPHSYAYTEYTQEPLLTGSPVEHSEQTAHICRLRRTDSYDGLGILVASDTRTRLNHFIREVESGSPGARAGLRKNDRIIGVNGINVENIEFNDVLLLIKLGLDEDNLQLSVIHEPEHI